MEVRVWVLESVAIPGCYIRGGKPSIAGAFNVTRNFSEARPFRNESDAATWLVQHPQEGFEPREHIYNM